MDDDKTVWCGNLSDKATEELVYELFLQVGPIDAVKIPKDREGKQMNYAFVSFDHEESVTYAQQALNGIRFFGRNLNVKLRTVKEPVQQSESAQEGEEICSPIVQHVDILPEPSHSSTMVQALEEPQVKPMSAPEFKESYHEFKERGRSNYNNYQQRNDYSSYRKYDHDNRNRGPSNNWHNYNNRGNYSARRGKYRPY